MIKKSFFGLVLPQFQYERLPAVLPEPDKVPPPKTITLLHEATNGNSPAPALKIGDKVKTGQKIALYADQPTYVVASATGTVSAIAPHMGDFGKTYSAISITVDAKELLDDQFEAQVREPTLASALDYLAVAPGSPPLRTLANSESPMKTIVITGVDSDLTIGTRQYIANSRLDDIKGGIKILKKISGIDHILLVTGRDTLQGFGHIGADVKSIDTAYPGALPPMIMKDVIGEVLPADKSCEEMGICFMSVEAVAAIGRAFASGRLPTRKVLTLIAKDDNQRLIECPIGTPVGDILNRYGVAVNAGDRIVFGGPMTGSAIYSMDQPVMPDTDAILVLDRARAAYSTNYPCINCGDCVRACPAKIAVNMLVRFLEAGQYQEAADNYDLYSCIECGLCSYVCVSKIPIFQYIRLAKYELERAKSAEETDV
jgi:electron transport complex protein RnfC